MSLLIEVMGPSGAGKSAIIDQATRLRSQNRPEWTSPAEAEAMVATISRGASKEALDDPEAADYARAAIHAVTTSTMKPSQMVTALGMLSAAESIRQAVRGCQADVPVVHDEMPLSRAFSSLLYADDFEGAAKQYFHAVPLPDAAVIVDADSGELAERVLKRRRPVNVYRGVDSDGIEFLARRAGIVADIAAQVLSERGVPTLRLNTGDGPATTAGKLHYWTVEQGPRTAPDPNARLREQLMDVSQTFQKGTERHERRNQTMAYCSFHTRRFSVLRQQAQRDSVRRLEQFGLTRSIALGRTVLDLGCYTGGMLLQASNLGIKHGLGVEYDAEKAETAQEIADLSGLGQLTFRQGDVDQLEPDEIGVRDFVFCLAIEAHVKDRDRLDWLLGKVTGRRLCFEGNGRCDVDDVVARLRGVGFRRFQHLGMSDDDIDPRNHNRPVLVAYK